MKKYVRQCPDSPCQECERMKRFMEGAVITKADPDAPVENTFIKECAKTGCEFAIRILKEETSDE